MYLNTGATIVPPRPLILSSVRSSCGVLGVFGSECYEFTPHDDLTELKIKGRGGTMVTPVFKYIEECLPEVETIVYFTDMGIWWDGESKEEPKQPVIWFATDNGYEEPPFGTVIEINP